jgi:hypothetical protein
MNDRLPPDPDPGSDFDGGVGLHKFAKSLAFFRCELDIEGFSDAEAYALTEAWMLRVMDQAAEGESDGSC